MKVEIRDKDFQGKAELQELLPIINTLNKLLANIVVYRSQKHKETFWNSEGTSVKKKWLQLDFCVVEKGVSRSDEKLPAEIRVETDPEKCEQYIEEFKREYQKWLLDYECRRAEKTEKKE
jgi:hypothetical protein